MGLRTPNEAVRVNFGAAPFRFDIEGLVLVRCSPASSSRGSEPTLTSPSHLQERKRAVLARLNSTDPSPSSFLPSPAPPIPALLPTSPHERTHETLQALISAYLVHHGYTATAAAFGAQVRAERVERATGLGPRRGAASSAGARDGTTGDGDGDGDGHEDGPDALLVSAAEASAVRADIRAAALEGRADDALVLLEAHYPSALAPSTPGGGVDTDPSGGILFRLRCRAFVEAALALSRSGASASAGPGDGLDALLARGQALHAAYGADPRPAVRDELQAVLGLVAYGDPEREATGRTRELLGERERDKVADEVNAAVLRASSLFHLSLSLSSPAVSHARQPWCRLAADTPARANQQARPTSRPSRRSRPCTARRARRCVSRETSAAARPPWSMCRARCSPSGGCTAGDDSEEGGLASGAGERERGGCSCPETLLSSPRRVGLRPSAARSSRTVGER